MQLTPLKMMMTPSPMQAASPNATLDGSVMPTKPVRSAIDAARIAADLPRPGIALPDMDGYGGPVGPPPPPPSLAEREVAAREREVAALEKLADAATKAARKW